ncbi:MAG: histidine kinase dimerization/phospho-acceptor domain-containing protein [Waterburya sp.]
MVSNYTSLNDFVYPIPICQPEADLGSILNIFRHSNCKLLAIPQNCGGWGIINAEDLLSLLTEIWWGKQTALVSHPSKVAYQQNIAHVTTQDFNSLIKPAMVYQADTEIDEFLNHLEYGTISSNQSEYLIVNTLGELQGKLDQTKIINYLALQAKQLSRNAPQLPTSLGSLGNLIDAIALPLKIETAVGDDLYQNKCWQELLKGKSPLDAAIHETNIQKVTWDRGKQRSPTQPDYEQHDDSQDNHSISLTNTRSGTYSLDSVTELPLTNFLTNFQTSHPNQNLAEEQLNEIITYHLGIEREEASDWNYLKLPLVTEQQFSQTNNSYWLVLATKAALPKPTESQESCSSTTSEAVTNKLLATVSHELKSPLTGIVGLSSLLQGQKIGQLNQRQARYVQLIHSSGQKMVGIVDDLLQLTSLAAEQLLEPELVNLEFLCRQLYQQALTKVQLTAGVNSDLVVVPSGLKLHIELGSEMAIANKLLLSCVLSHLILETMGVSESLDNLNIEISNVSGLTEIAISSNFMTPRSWSSLPENPDSPWSNSGLDLMIAEYLAKILQGNISSTYAPDSCRFTLMLPQHKIPQNQDQLSDNSTTNSSSTPQKTANHNLTILCLYPESEATDPETNHGNGSNFNLKNWSDNNEQQANYQHRIIEADSLEQAHTLARIWQLDVIVLDSYQIVQPAKYLRSLQESEYLAALPIVTLDTKTTETANQIEGLNVYPCLLPAKHRSFEDLMQVIQIATGT